MEMTMIPIPVPVHEHRPLPRDRRLKELRCWSEECGPKGKRLLALYDPETRTLFTRCKCGSWQPIDLAAL